MDERIRICDSEHREEGQHRAGLGPAETLKRHERPFSLEEGVVGDQRRNRFASVR